MNLTVYTSRHSKESAIALGNMLNCAVYNPYTREHYREYPASSFTYNMGCSNQEDSGFNSPYQVSICTNKVSTLDRLESFGVLTVPYTRNAFTAQEWLNKDRIIVNRATITGKANEGLSYSYKGLPDVEDTSLNFNSIIWTRYVNHTRELRVYAIDGEYLAFEKKEVNNLWHFHKIKVSDKLREQLDKASQAFDKMFVIAYDILECVTGDYYFLEANSAPSLLAHRDILPTVGFAIQHKLGD